MQLIVNTSGTAAYVLSSNLPSILVFDIGNQSASTIALAGNAMPLNASLSTDGTTLYVGANDNSLHVIDTNLAIDTTQVTFPKSLCLDSTGNDFPGLTCQPDLVAVRP
jgi:DNA-binding beta-propeller fold protein YncE